MPWRRTGASNDGEASAVMAANERPCRRQLWTSSVIPPSGSDLNFTTSCPGTTANPPIFAAPVPTGPEFGRLVVGFPADAAEAPAGELRSTDDWLLVFSLGGDEPQPAIAVAIANGNDARQRRLHPIDRIMIAFSRVQTHTLERGALKLA